MPKVKKTTKKEVEKKKVKKTEEKTKKKYFYAIGRRKTAVAQVRLYPGKGEIIVNEKPYKEYFSTYLLQKAISEPFLLIGSEKKFDIVVKIKGGGKRGQAEAIRLGVARALLDFNQSLRKSLKKAGYLTRDPRKKERKKYGYRGARRGRQFRKR